MAVRDERKKKESAKCVHLVIIYAKITRVGQKIEESIVRVSTIDVGGARTYIGNSQKFGNNKARTAPLSSVVLFDRERQSVAFEPPEWNKSDIDSSFVRINFAV